MRPKIMGCSAGSHPSPGRVLGEGNVDAAVHLGMMLGPVEEGDAVKPKCDQCDKLATNHSVEIVNGQKIEKHLCDAHAAEAGLAANLAPSSFSDLLSNIVKPTTERQEQSDLACENCGLAYREFCENSLLGCQGCYDAFETQLGALIERAHEGGTHHLGKVPRRARAGEQRQQQVLRMQKRLSEAITAEDYELAARLRDDIKRAEEQLS